jgi:hypothetical protein
MVPLELVPPPIAVQIIRKHVTNIDQSENPCDDDDDTAFSNSHVINEQICY